MYLFNKLVIIFLPIIPKFIVRMVSKRYVAGPDLEDGIRTVKDLNARGICATMDVLGESVNDLKECDESIQEYFNVLDRIHYEKLDCNISVKLTQLGLIIDKEQCYKNIYRIVEKADKLNIFVRIDMEDASVTSDTIDIFLRLHKKFSKTGIVLQAYLRRCLDDLKMLAKQKINMRICKGIYIEARTVAFKDPDIINNNFALLMDAAFKAGSYIGIATHDEKVVWYGLELIHRYKLKTNQYEFQMLLGVDEELRDILVDEGHRLRVYVPFGKQWYAYCTRRLRENPKIAFYVMKAMFGIK
ncbi:proline dehydrogenase family protein [candidate division KSB1 bacterium]|nr:proline dehydrogenase family protein [candidate division KSB1 bacterium]